MRKAIGWGFALLQCWAGLWAQQPAAATLTTIARFDEHGKDNGPSGPVVADASGALYGVLAWNDVTQGVVYKLTPPGSPGGAWTTGIAYEFAGGAGGGFVSGGLILDAQGNLYGVTGSGGQFNTVCPFGCGVVFELVRPRAAGEPWKGSVLYTFTGGSDGAFPTGPLLLNDGVLYGTATAGGNLAGNCQANGGCGVVFQLSLPVASGGAWIYQTLYGFAGGSDGQDPTGGLIRDASGALYGATYLGGGANAGTVYSLTPPSAAGGAWTETVLHGFNGTSDGATPYGLTPGANGVLYGPAYGGGAAANCGGCGTIFQLRPPAQAGGDWTFAVIFAFADARAQGANPTSLMVGPGGELYGAALGGGGQPEDGAIFTLTPPSTAGARWTETVIYDFGGKGTVRPAGLSMGAGGVLYGITYGGWALYPARYLGPGTVFELTQ